MKAEVSRELKKRPEGSSTVASPPRPAL